MKIGSLCTGYGGLDLAVEKHFGGMVTWCSEIEAAPAKVLETRYPGVPNVGDLTLLDWGDLEKVDILCGGFPCQPFSTAGLRKGEEDERAIFQYIADGISVLRPGIVILENVPGLLTLGGVSVIGALTSLGYECRWGVIRASDAGAPHRRARWFCIGYATGRDGRHQKPETLYKADGQATEPRKPASAVTDCWAEYGPAIRRWSTVMGRPPAKPVTEGKLNPWFLEWMMGLEEGWVCDIDLSRSQKLKIIGNGVVPQQAALAFKLLA
jgi:DNA (cytosine-5)-methyltransferase 1